jgi:hypothetical protein
MSAWLADTGRISTDANANRQGRIELFGSDSFMFASPLKKRAHHAAETSLKNIAQEATVSVARSAFFS